MSSRVRRIGGLSEELYPEIMASRMAVWSEELKKRLRSSMFSLEEEEAEDSSSSDASSLPDAEEAPWDADVVAWDRTA